MSGLLKGSISQIFIKYVDNCKNILLVYCIVTFFAIIFDFTDFIIQFIRFGREGDEHSELTMLFASLLFLALDIYYFLWIMQAKYKFPSEVSQYISKALFGFANNMKTQLFMNMHNMQAKKK